MKHALGLSCSKRPYRNHYNTNDDRSWNILCDLGLANKYKVENCSGDFMYLVSDGGIKFIQKDLTSLI